MANDLTGARVVHREVWPAGPIGTVLSQVGPSILIRWQWGESSAFTDDVVVVLP